MTIRPIRPGPKTKRLARQRFYRLIHDWTLERDSTFLERARRHVPDAWHVLELDLDVEEPKEKVTLYLDRSVARMFRAMGKGYHSRINRILATWAQMKMAELSVLEQSHLEAIKAAEAEKDREEPVPAPRVMTELHEFWAYRQGLADGRKKRD